MPWSWDRFESSKAGEEIAQFLNEQKLKPDDVKIVGGFPEGHGGLPQLFVFYYKKDDAEKKANARKKTHAGKATL